LEGWKTKLGGGLAIAVGVLGYLVTFFGYQGLAWDTAMGMVSDIISTFARKPIFGHAAIIFSGITIGFLGFTVWVHHMFAAGLGPVTNAVFAASTMLISAMSAEFPGADKASLPILEGWH